MSQKKYDMAVAYRIYPKLSKGKHPPPVHSKDKFKLSEFCVRSFKNSLGDMRVKMWVLFDNCPPEYEALFTKLWPAEDLVLLRFPGIGDGGTLREQSRILMEQTDAEIVYYAEDDYFYLPGGLVTAVEFLKQNSDADFVAAHESSDFYTADLHAYRRDNREFDGKKWNTVVSTTHTFMARRGTLIEARAIFEKSYGKISPDLSKWMALTKKRVFNPVKFVWWSISHKWFWAGSVAIAWYFCWREILFLRKFKLWAPHTAMAAHMGVGVESPGIDWQRAFQKQLADYPQG